MAKPSQVWPNGVKPQIGDIARSEDVGREGRAIHIWEACPQCGMERWIKRNTSGSLCKGCAVRNHSFGEQNRRWNPSRRTVTKSGIRVYIDRGNPYFCMAHHCSRDYAILEHHLVMAEHLGRPLKQGEVVHHIDGNNLNNDITNLLLLPSQTHHTAYTMLQQQVNRVERDLAKALKRIAILEVENIALYHQLDTYGIGNPELSGSAETLPKCVETIDHPSQEDEKIVHSPRKLGGESA